MHPVGQGFSLAKAGLKACPTKTINFDVNTYYALLSKRLTKFQEIKRVEYRGHRAKIARGVSLIWQRLLRQIKNAHLSVISP